MRVRRGRALVIGAVIAAALVSLVSIHSVLRSSVPTFTAWSSVRTPGQPLGDWWNTSTQHCQAAREHGRTVALIRRNQFRSDCSTAKYLKASIYDQGQFGSSLCFYRGCLAAAINTGRILVIDWDALPHSGHLDPWTNCSVPPNADVQQCTFRSDGHVNIDSVKNTLYESPPDALADHGRLWWNIHALAFLASPRRGIAPDALDADRFAGMHVRRTDKAREARPVPMSDFVHELDRVASAAAADDDDDRTMVVRIATDDPEVVLPEFDEVTRGRSPSRLLHRFLRSDHPTPRAETADEAVNAVVDLQHSNPLAVTFSSNFGQWAMALKVAHDLDAGRSGEVILFDAEWFGWVIPDPTAILGAEWTTDASRARRARALCSDGQFYEFDDFRKRPKHCAFSTTRIRYSFDDC
ncbi:GT23 domain-containing protein [Plasmodiophora brassicae]|uniref:GT23 domain-containing protein n=1 Tax=Plasmodiophora brassicae TaxID=37360 RepID=A0A0G4IY81_PLABS|nr:hypothetical protein PBRA_008009 [Plasmodiophora brassicae]SPQ95057.1 unnamed protein product [Plasmodiophora brassicae]